MKFKNTTKKLAPKKSAAEPKDTAKEQLSKEEIKEIVAEAVEEKLEQKEEKSPETLPEKVEATTAQPSVEVTEPSEEEMHVDQNEPDEVHAEEPQIKISTTAPEVMPTTDKTEEPEDAVTQKLTDAIQPDTQTAAGTMPAISVSTSSPDGATGSSEKEANKKSPLILLFIVFLICGFVVGISILFLLSKNNYKLPNVASLVPFGKHAPTPTAVAAATPTPEKVDIAKYTIRVLNGSGVAGAAGQTKDDLTSEGFTVTATGNATDDVTETTISAKSSVDQAALSKLTEALSKKYTVSSQIGSLQDSENTDIVVTISTAK